MPHDTTLQSIGSRVAERVVTGDHRGIADAISLIENDHPASAELIAGIFGRTGRAYRIGLTGPPGAGKSTLVDGLIRQFRARYANVGVIAIDPSSTLTGGSLLGDRVRMHSHASDAGVFIRSMATRGHLGGLSRSTDDAALVLDAAGMDIVLIETVGVGQDEIDIARTADVSIVALVPGMGDEIQALKAGVMEIADIFVINKADREGAELAAQTIKSSVHLRSPATPDAWQPPVVKTIATTGEGIAVLVDEIYRFREHSAGTQAERRRRHGAETFRELLREAIMAHVETYVLRSGEIDGLIDRIAVRQIDPRRAAADLIGRVFR